MKKRSVLIAGHPTSVSLEEEFWEALKGLAQARGMSVNALIEEIDSTRSGNLSSAIRVHVLNAVQGRGEGGCPRRERPWTGGGGTATPLRRTDPFPSRQSVRP